MNHTTKRFQRLLLASAALGLALGAVGVPAVAVAASDVPPGPGVTDFPPGPNVSDYPPGPGVMDLPPGPTVTDLPPGPGIIAI